MKKIIVILDFTTGKVNKIEYYDNKKPLQHEELEELICEHGYDINNIEWMTTTEDKILLDGDDLFNGYCPECDCDDLEQIDDTMEYQELECSNNHKFVVETKGWTISNIDYCKIQGKELKNKTVHDWTSHASDAFRYFAVGNNQSSEWTTKLEYNNAGII